MTEKEALQVLNVTAKRPKWLLSQVHPDRHPEWRAAAERAAARVNEAMDGWVQGQGRAGSQKKVTSVLWGLP